MNMFRTFICLTFLMALSNLVIAQELEASGMNGLVATDDDELYTENDT